MKLSSTEKREVYINIKEKEIKLCVSLKVELF